MRRSQLNEILADSQALFAKHQIALPPFAHFTPNEWAQHDLSRFQEVFDLQLGWDVYAITGNTAAEIVYNRVDSKKENMGLTTWENSPDGKILKSDVIIAKNYLNEQEIKNLNNLVNLFLDIAENNAERNITMYMEDWKNEVENALKVFHYEVLEGKGKISHKQATKKAENEYEKYKVIQDKNYVSDFDRLLSETKQIENK